VSSFGSAAGSPGCGAIAIGAASAGGADAIGGGRSGCGGAPRTRGAASPIGCAGGAASGRFALLSASAFSTEAMNPSSDGAAPAGAGWRGTAAAFGAGFRGRGKIGSATGMSSSGATETSLVAGLAGRTRGAGGSAAGFAVSVAHRRPDIRCRRGIGGGRLAGDEQAALLELGEPLGELRELGLRLGRRGVAEGIDLLVDGDQFGRRIGARRKRRGNLRRRGENAQRGGDGTGAAGNRDQRDEEEQAPATAAARLVEDCRGDGILVAERIVADVGPQVGTDPVRDPEIGRAARSPERVAVGDERHLDGVDDGGLGIERMRLLPAVHHLGRHVRVGYDRARVFSRLPAAPGHHELSPELLSFLVAGLKSILLRTFRGTKRPVVRQPPGRRIPAPIG